MSEVSDRGFDGDAKFALLISMLSGLLTLGLSHLFIFLRVKKQAINCKCLMTNISAIAVPGHALHNGKISTDYQARLDRAAKLFWESEEVMIRVLGGCPQNEISEARAGYDYLSAIGIPEHSVSMEDISTNTLQNLSHSREWFKQFNEVILVTNRYHIERLRTMAKGLKLPVKMCAAENVFKLRFSMLLIETLYLHLYWAGRLYAQLTKNKRMLDKIF